VKVFIRRISSYGGRKQMVFPKELHEKLGHIARIEYNEEKNELVIKFPFSSASC